MDMNNINSNTNGNVYVADIIVRSSRELIRFI